MFNKIKPMFNIIKPKFNFIEFSFNFISELSARGLCPDMMFCGHVEPREPQRGGTAARRKPALKQKIVPQQKFFTKNTFDLRNYHYL